MARFALFSSLLLAAAVSVDLVGHNLTGPARSVFVALLTSQCGLLTFAMLLAPGRPLARSAFFLATTAVMSAVFQLSPDLLLRLLAVNGAAAMAVAAIGYRSCPAAAVDANHKIRKNTQKVGSAPGRFQFSLAQLFALVTLVSLFLGFMKLWPPQPSRTLDVPLLVTIAFATLSGFATTIVLARWPCCRAVWLMFFTAIGITTVFLPIRYPQLGSWGFALVALHVTLTVAMLFVLRTAGLRIERRPFVGLAFAHGNLTIAVNQNPTRQ